MTLSRLPAILVLLVACAALYLPGLTALPPFDQDEARFAQASRQMLETGDFLTIRFQDELRNRKPPLTYWLQAASAALSGAPDSIWPYRLPSLVGVSAAVLLTWWFGVQLFGAAVGLIGALLFAGTISAGVQAHMARADGVLIALVVAAQGALAVLYVADQRSRPAPSGLWVMFWIAQALAMLAKGPILAFTSALTVAALAMAPDRRWLAGLRPLPGLILALAVAAPWFIVSALATDDGFVVAALQEDLLPKLLGVQDDHGGPPGYYLVTGLVMFWPASLLIVPAAAFAWRNRDRPDVRVLAAWVVPTWLVYEAVPTKLPHYTLPTYPALALLCAAALIAGIAATTSTRVWLLVWGIVGLGCAAFGVLVPLRLGTPVGPLLGLATLAALAAAAAAGPAWRGAWRTATAIAMVSGGIWAALLWQFGLPGIDRLWIAPALADAVRAHGAAAPRAEPPVVVSGTDLASVVFLLGTATILGDGARAADHLIDRPGSVVAVENTIEGLGFDARLRARGFAATPAGEVAGFDYVYGTERRLRIFSHASLSPLPLKTGDD